MITNELVEKSIIVKGLTEAANRVAWVPYDEIEAYFTRYEEMGESLSYLLNNFDERETFLHDYGARLVIRYRVYDNVGRTWRHGLFGDVALAEEGDIPPQMLMNYQPFYQGLFINLHRHCEVTHFAFLLVA